MNFKRSHTIAAFVSSAALLVMLASPSQATTISREQGDAPAPPGGAAPDVPERLGSLSFAPESAPPGSVVQVRNADGSACPDDSSQVELKMKRPELGGPNIATALTAVSAGSFVANLEIPQTVAPGDYLIDAICLGGQTARSFEFSPFSVSAPSTADQTTTTSAAATTTTVDAGPSTSDLSQPAVLNPRFTG